MRLGAIGLGGLGSIELDVYDDLDDVEIVGGADISPDSREAFEADHDAPAYEQYEDLLDEHALDAVSIVTPHTLHHEQASACLERDCHVFVEKPMTTDLEDAVDLVSTAEERDLVLQVGYQRHFDPAFREVKRLVDEGRIGDVHMVTGHLGQDWIDGQRDAWRADPKLSGGGQLYDSGSHLLDALLWTTGTEPRSVAAAMDYREHDVDVNSALAATLDRDGSTVTASVGVSGDGRGGEPHDALVIWGTEGRIDYSDGDLTVAEGGASYAADVEGDADFGTVTRRKLANFVDAVHGEAEPAVPGEYGLQVTAFTEAAYEAYETGSTVDVRERLDDARKARRAARAD